MKNKIFLSLLLITVAWILPAIARADSFPVSGFAYSENIGWIQFHLTSQGGGVYLDSETGKFSGYAWSRGATTDGGVGWISFNRAETGAPPSDDPCFDGTCIAKVENISQLGSQNVNVVGWARVLSVCDSIPCSSSGPGSNSGGWDGWIRFDHNKTDYKVYIDTTGDFHKWAWSDMVIGWISFNSADPEAGGADYKVTLDLTGINQRPLKPTSSETWNHCSIQELSIPTFNWTYSDPGGAPQGAAYQIKIYGETTFDETISSQSTSYTPTYVWIQNNLSWDKAYSWQVRVQDSQGAWSDWSDSDSFTMPDHAYPWIDFSWSPLKPTKDEEVTFTDESVVYDGNPTGSAWSWVFPGGDPSSSIEEQPITKFSDTGPKIITLTVTDSDGLSCPGSKTLNIQLPLPEWREIPPFSWVNKLLAMVTNLFKNL